MTRAGLLGVLLRHDARLLRRDWILVVLLFGLPLAALLLRWFVPWLTGFLLEYVDLEPYRALIVAGLLVSNQPVFLGVVIGLLLIEEREQGTLLAIEASPLSAQRFLGYRVLVATLISFVLIPIDVLLAGLASVSWPVLLASSALASLTVPVVALVYATFVRNKVQALVWIRPVQGWAAVGVALYFAPTPWEWILAPLVPLYYPMRLFWGATEGPAEWWLVLPSLVLPLAGTWWLARRFRGATVAG